MTQRARTVDRRKPRRLTDRQVAELVLWHEKAIGGNPPVGEGACGVCEEAPHECLSYAAVLELREIRRAAARSARRRPR